MRTMNRMRMMGRTGGSRRAATPCPGRVSNHGGVACLLVGGVLLAGVPLARTNEEPTPPQAPATAAAVSDKAPAPELIAVDPPPFSEDIFPCSECHDGTDVDRTRREVEDHDTVIFEHDAENRWCLDCHDAENRDMLHLANGDLLPFEESYRLCGQCHGPKLRDWKAGEHGKRTGEWSGAKQYLLCAHCHDPHSPGIKPMEAMPPPIRPEDLR